MFCYFVGMMCKISIFHADHTTKMVAIGSSCL